MTQPAPPRSHAERLRDYAEIETRQELGGSTYFWSKGDLLVEELGHTSTSGTSGNLAAFLRECESTDNYEMASAYRLVAAAFAPETRRPEIPWSCYRMLAGHDDRLEKLAAFATYCEDLDQQREKGVRYGRRRLEQFLGRRVSRQIVREDLVPQVVLGLGDMTDDQRRMTLAGSSLEVRQQMLRELVADPEVFAPAVNQRANGGVSDIERAFFEARAPFVAETAMEYERARQITREQHAQALLDAPGDSNRRFLDQMDNRVRNDATHYEALARTLAEPVLQQHGGLMSASRYHFEMLITAVQHCLDALPDSDVPTEDDGSVIDATVREAIERFALGDGVAVVS